MWRPRRAGGPGAARYGLEMGSADARINRFGPRRRGGSTARAGTAATDQPPQLLPRLEPLARLPPKPPRAAALEPKPARETVTARAGSAVAPCLP